MKAKHWICFIACLWILVAVFVGEKYLGFGKGVSGGFLLGAGVCWIILA
jgi:hypothetical protein